MEPYEKERLLLEREFPDYRRLRESSTASGQVVEEIPRGSWNADRLCEPEPSSGRSGDRIENDQLSLAPKTLSYQPKDARFAEPRSSPQFYVSMAIKGLVDAGSRFMPGKADSAYRRADAGQRVFSQICQTRARRSIISIAS
jgi:hypothetical protein